MMCDVRLTVTYTACLQIKIEVVAMNLGKC